ncbi:hypothetical protein LCGC14_1891760 [marine sediment metagenome]|uniref:Uncharacterized protein n=1 Tax=marine sediment metagenome TaxID=412755 RepID=A0A0F9FZH1_9ZZZZ
MQVIINDNNGNKAAPGCVAADPIAASGILLTDGTIGANHTQTVVGGAIYAVTFVGAASTLAMYFGIADVTTDANVIWVCVPYETILIKIPEGTTTLNYEGAANSASVRIRRIA